MNRRYLTSVVAFVVALFTVVGVLHEQTFSTRAESRVRPRQVSLSIDQPPRPGSGAGLPAAGDDGDGSPLPGDISPLPLVTNGKPASQVTSPALVAADCPTSSQEWATWRRQMARDLVRAMRGIFDLNTRSVESAAPVVREWKNCEPEATRAAASVQSCPDNLSTYMHALWLRTEKGYRGGYRVSDASYYEKADAMTAIPAELQAPELLRQVTQFGRLARAKSYLQRLNQSRPDDQKMVFFSYRSQHLGTPDNIEAFGRLLVVVPGNPEKWIQYGVPEFPRQSVRNVSIVAVDRQPDGAQDVYFRDRAVIRDDNERLVLQGRFELGVGVDACVDCHKAGVNPIFPTPGSVSADELALIDQVNRRFLTYVPPSFHGDYDPSWFGPGLGTFRPNASPDVLRQRVREALGTHGEAASADQVESVAQHVNCAECHQPSFLEPLNAPLNPKMLRSYVLGGQMPPGANLTPPEKQALVDVLLDDYFSSGPPEDGILMDWLLERCFRNQVLASSP